MTSRYEQFTAAISSIYQHFQKIERNEMERYGLRGSYTQYLLAIDRSSDGITAAKLSDVCDKDKAAVSRVVTEMEKQGLIIREFTGERAYRAKLYLTEEGKKAAEFVRQRSKTAVELAGQGLSDTDRAVMYLALERIAANLIVISSDGMPEDDTYYFSETKTNNNTGETNGCQNNY